MIKRRRFIDLRSGLFRPRAVNAATANLTIWDYYPERIQEINKLNRPLRAAIQNIAKDSQAHLDARKEIGYASDRMLVNLTQVEVDKLLFGQTAEEILERICFRNTDQFLAKYFTNQYLTAPVSNSEAEGLATTATT